MPMQSRDFREGDIKYDFWNEDYFFVTSAREIFRKPTYQEAYAAWHLITSEEERRLRGRSPH